MNDEDNNKYFRPNPPIDKMDIAEGVQLLMDILLSTNKLYRLCKKENAAILRTPTREELPGRKNRIPGAVINTS